MSKTKRIAVVGAGLGGLTAAGFLQRAGLAVAVYEQAPAFSRIGAGIILSANVSKVLRRLGLEDGLIAAGIKSERYVSRAWDTGATMYEIVFDADSERHYGGPYIHIHRGDLHAVLERGVASGTIMFDHQLVGLKETRDGVRLKFGNAAASPTPTRNRTRSNDPSAPIATATGRTAATAVRAVNTDHQMIAKVSTRFAPQRSPSHPPGI